MISLKPRALLFWLLRAVSLSPGVHWAASRLTNESFLVGVMGIVRDDRNRLLLFRHTYRREPWGLPGGWMVRGESPLEALEREVREESGLEVRATRLLLVGATPDRPKLEFVVEARLVGGSFRPSSEVSALEWRDEADVGALSSAQRRLLALAARLAPGETGCYPSPWTGHNQRARPGPSIGQ